jgi:polyisoprenoid-binding protein YceI
MTTTAPQHIPALATRWTVDPARSDAEFAVKTVWGAMTVHGRFERFEGWYESGPEGVSIDMTLNAESLDTGHQTRDRHLRSADFFHVAMHPHVRFRSTSVRPTGNGRVHVKGDLTAAGTTIPLEFDAKVQPVGDDLQIEAWPTVDHRGFGMSSGRLGMIRPPAKLHVKALLTSGP